MKISSGVLKALASQVKKEIILVCGTNGKTTTNNLIYSLLSKDGSKVVCNNVGANMLPGVACAFIKDATVFGKLDADYAAIECDEACLRHIIKHLTPSKIVITNLFRDQTDRYGEIDGTVRLIKEALDKVPSATLILNADDPYTRQFGIGRKAIYFGVSENVLDSQSTESFLCAHCDSALDFDYRQYNQLGSYKCPACGYSRPNPDYSATRIKCTDGLDFVLSYKGMQEKFSVNYRGFYNIYNLMAAFAAYESSGGDAEAAKEVFSSYKPRLGRMEKFVIGGKTVILNLAKNPTGFNQAFAAVNNDERTKDVLIAVNDMPSDGTDVSWLWDTEFENLSRDDIKRVYAGGTRRDETALRLKYAGIENPILTDINEASLMKIIESDSEVCYMIVNYTVLFDTQNILKSLEDK